MALIDNKPKQQGSGFTNLQRIMNASRGSRLGQAVGQGIQQTGQQARQRLGQAQSEFQEQSQAGRLDTEQNRQRVDQILGSPEGATEQEFKEFDRFRAGGYSGPETLKDAESIRGQAQEAQNLGQQIGSAGGRQALLQRYAAGPRQYQSGQQRLDSLVLGATGNKDLKEARRSVSGIGQQAQSVEAGARETGKQFQNLAQGFGREATERATGLATEALTPAQERAKAANEADAALRNQAETDRLRASSENYLSRQALEQLGLGAGERTYGVNLGDFVKYQGRDIAQQATPEELMSQAEFQKFGNLRRLMGGNTAEFDPTKVGGYQEGQLQYNKEGLQQAIQTNKAKIQPWEDKMNHYQKIADVYSKYGINAGTNLSGFNALRAQAAMKELQAMGLGGALGGNAAQNVSFAFNELAKAQQDFNDYNQQYKGNVKTDENGNPLPPSNLGLENMPGVK